MKFALWCTIIGILLIMMAVAGSLLRRLPLSTSMLYLAVGCGLGPAGLDLLDGDPFGETALFERLTEIALLISLFVTGLKLSVPMRDARWLLPLRLATVSMVITVALIALAAVFGMGMSLGAAILLGGILAPTDPVLASDVQVEHAGDRDRVRFGLSGEGGLNDGVAFPFVMLGLGLLGLHELGTGGWKWLMLDVLWGIGGGLAIGAALGYLVGKLIVYLRVHHREAVGLDEFVALGLIALAYGTALLAHALGFLAVFAAGLALRHIEERPSDRATLHEALKDASDKAETDAVEAEHAVATNPEHAGAYMTEAVLGFNEQLESIAEITVVLIVGAMLWHTFVPSAAIWFTPLLFLLIRPLSVVIGLVGVRSTLQQRALTSWFGIRGIGSIYYLLYAIGHGIERALADQLIAITLLVVSTSIVIHGISVTPLMRRYARGRKANAGAAAK